MPTVYDVPLRQLITSIFAATGAPALTARTVADSLVEADLAGHDSHGVIRVSEYLGEIRKGTLKPQAQPTIVGTTATTLQVHGNRGFGVVVATWAMEQLLAKGVGGIAAATITGCGHIGRAGVYPAMAAERGMIGLAFVNGGARQPRVVPYGGTRPVFGTNPLAAAVPQGAQPPIVLDFSTAVVAAGKIRVVRDRGELLPEGWILDREGRPSRQPQDYYDGGMLLPAAEHKGYALGLLVEILGGLLTGAGTPALPESGYEVGNGVLFIVVDIAAFRPLETFAAQVRDLVTVLHASAPEAGTGEVLLPGEPELRSRERRRVEGIPLAEATWHAILDAARTLDVTVEGF